MMTAGSQGAGGGGVQAQYDVLQENHGQLPGGSVQKQREILRSNHGARTVLCQGVGGVVFHGCPYSPLRVSSLKHSLWRKMF